MSGTFLDKIVAKTSARIKAVKTDASLAEVRLRAEKVRETALPLRLRAALERPGRMNIIAEIKRASPSKGVINNNVDVAATARRYETGGAAAISVLTEGEYFGGSLDDLTVASRSVRIPVLRKDFIVDEYQIFEAAASGAAAVLLIVAALGESEIAELLRVTRDFGMDAIVEVHTLEELRQAAGLGAQIIGVNNRDLQTLDVSLDVSRNLIKSRPEDALMVAESGLTGRDDIVELCALGFDGFLVGEALMRSGDAAATLGDWIE